MYQDGSKELIGGCGNWDKVQSFINWYGAKAAAGEINVEGANTVIDAPNVDGASFVVINELGDMYMLVDSGQWAEVTDDWLTMGSGGDFAAGALSAGASELEAMKIAHKFDVNTGKQVVKRSL